MKIIAWIILLAAIAVLPILRERRRRPISKAERQASEYEFAEISKGTTAYRWHGGVRGPVIVAVHGLTTPSQVWDDLIPHFTDIGYRVVTYDLYGRGLSDAPKGRQTSAFFQRQLTDLLDHLELKKDVTLIGYSMGGAIVSGFAANNLHRIDRVFMIAGAGVRLNETFFEIATRRLPGIGRWLSGMFLERQLRRDMKRNPSTQELDAIRVRQLDQTGYIPAVHSSRKHLLSYPQLEEHRILREEGIATFAIWGERDEIIPLASSGVLSKWNRLARQEVIDDARHDLLQTHTEAVADAMKRLLRA